MLNDCEFEAKLDEDEIKVEGKKKTQLSYIEESDVCQGRHIRSCSCNVHTFRLDSLVRYD